MRFVPFFLINFNSLIFGLSHYWIYLVWFVSRCRFEPFSMILWRVVVFYILGGFCRKWRPPIRNEQRCCSTAEWLQEALQKSCKSAGLQQPQILAAVESPLTAINNTFAAVQRIPESRSALQSGFEKTKNVVTGNGLPLVSTKKNKKCRLVYTHTRYKSTWHRTNLQQSRFVNV